jgi:hypothetical protein
MAKKHSGKQKASDKSELSPEEIIRRAMNVKRPPSGWPWENKRKSTTKA